MAKRSNGEGSIYQRAGRKGWYASVTVDGRRKIVHAPTRREVDEELTRMKAAKKSGDLVVGKSPTLAAFLQQWLEEVIRPNKSAWTWRGYRAAVDTHIVPAVGKVKVEQLGAAHVQALLNRMRENGASPKTAANVRIVLRSALTTAVKFGLTTVNVASRVDPPKVPQHDIQPLDRAEARAFLAAVRGDRLEALYVVAVTMGLRQGEALGLTWADVDLEAGVLAVREQLQRVDGKLTRVSLKTKRSKRTLTMPAPAVAALAEHRARQASVPLPGAYVFTNTVGKPMEARRLVTEFKAILKRAGLRDIRFHDLRHSAATLLLIQGVPARVVMEILGHSQQATTTNTYQHVVPELQREAAERMSALFT